MERGSSVGNNGGQAMLRLPIGFRFRPTDEELLIHYLKRKALSLPLPAPVVIDSDVFVSNPWSLPGDLGEKRYYFCKGKDTSFAETSNGFWKTNGKVKQIVASFNGINYVLGTKKMWAFYQKNDSFGWSKTLWGMHEFQLPKPIQNPNGQIEDWAVCKVFMKKKSSNKPVYYTGFDNPTYIDLKMEENNIDVGPPEPSSPSSSGEMIVSSSDTGAID